MSGHGCRQPRSRRRYFHTPWVCDCGQGWRLKRNAAWNLSWSEWVRWPA